MKTGSKLHSTGRGRQKSSPSGNGKSQRAERAANILLVPGLGADVDMYLPILRELARSGFPMQIHYLRLAPPLSFNETMKDYTQRIVNEQLRDENRSFDCVVGASMGGMISQQALEDGLISTPLLILVCTLYHGSQLTPLAKMGAMLVRFVPSFLRRVARLITALLYPLFRFYTPWSVLFARMLLRADADLLFTAPVMIRNWRSERRADQIPNYNCALFHFHGTLDPLISYRKISAVRKPEFSETGGGHLTFVSRAREIAGIIDSKCRV